MKIALKAILWTKDKDKSGLCPIAISIIGGGKRTYYNTGIKILKKHWSKGVIKKEAENADIKNNQLSGLIKDTEREILNNELQGLKLTVQDVKALFNPKIKTGSFTKFYRAYIDNLIVTNKKAEGTIAVWETEYKKFVEFAGDKPFREVNTTLLNKYHAHIVQYRHPTSNEGYEATTIFKKLKKLRQIIRKAIIAGMIEEKQVAGFEMVQYVAPDKDYLTLEEIETIGNAIYKGELDVDPVMKQVACFFVIGCYSGLRISDWRRFKIEKLIDGDSLKVSAMKNNEPIYIPLKVFTRLAKIIYYVRDNNIRLEVTDQAANRVLKFLGAKLNLPELTAHKSRHTAATLLGQMGYSAFAIGQILGISEKTAQTYRKATKQGLEREYEISGGL